MEPEQRQLLDDEDIQRKTGLEKNDVYHVINSCREHKKDITADQAATFLARLAEESNRTLFLSDCGPYLRDFDAEGMKKMVLACKYNKGKRAVIVNLASRLGDEVTLEQKQEICDLISANFEKNKAKKAFGI